MLDNLNWEKMDNLLPAIVQDNASQKILMLGYMNQAALQQTLASGRITFFSRSKQRLWVKGETSGNYLMLCDISPDCDKDALLIKATPLGPTCHEGSLSCFSLNILAELAKTIAVRQKNRPKDSYVVSLLDKGVARIAQKVGEEGLEVALAAVQGEKEALKQEMADLLFHMMVLLQSQEIALPEVLNVLKERMK